MNSIKKVGSRVSNMMSSSMAGLLILGLAASLLVVTLMYTGKSCPSCPPQTVMIPGKIETKTIETTKQTLVTDNMVSPNSN